MSVVHSRVQKRRSVEVDAESSLTPQVFVQPLQELQAVRRGASHELMEVQFLVHDTQALLTEAGRPRDQPSHTASNARRSRAVRGKPCVCEGISHKTEPGNWHLDHWRVHCCQGSGTSTAFSS